MKIKILLLSALILISIKSFAQLNTFYVKPHVIDTAYLTAQDSHYVALSASATSNNLLLVFLDGSGSNTKDYTDIPKLAASLGYHVVSIAYPNSPTVGSLCDSSTDSLCFDKVRQEICYGTPVSSSVSVDTLNSINIRLTKLLQYLSATYPANGWNQFLSNNNVVWSSVVTSGHSQGSGHAMYLAKTQSVHRVIMFSGVDDYSLHFNKSAHWLFNTSLTPTAGIYSFLHLQDDVEPYKYEYKNLQTLGLMANGDDSTNVDNLSTPYNNSHCLYTNATPSHSTIPSAYHDATAVDYFTPVNGTQLLFNPVWTYMLTALSTTDINQVETSNNQINIYPNPAANKVFILSDKNVSSNFTLTNLLGQVVLNQTDITSLSNNVYTINIQSLPAGVYFINTGNYYHKLIKE
ncbi:MAG TPA: T9SS type A sorting domain-containing protein [Bacteroidia bacterium]|nr:T9SS type A sorting domain-containing protein [Bacteroidia bacterium]